MRECWQKNTLRNVKQKHYLTTLKCSNTSKQGRKEEIKLLGCKYSCIASDLPIQANLQDCAEYCIAIYKADLNLPIRNQ